VTERYKAAAIGKPRQSHAKAAPFVAATLGVSWLVLFRDDGGGQKHDEIVSGTGQTTLERAMDLYDAAKYEQALAAFTSAIAVDSSNPQAFHERGMTYLELHQPDLALVDFKHALELDPAFPGARESLARTLDDRGQHLEAAKEWLTVARSESLDEEGMGVSPLTWADCAEAFEKGGASEKALLILDEYFEHYANKVTYRRSQETAPLRLKAKLLLKQPNAILALEYAERAARSEHVVPADVVVHALALEAAGRFGEALQATDRAAEMNGPFPETTALRARLEAKTP
jgi:tetratricopeptide (TPR) repeat protein